MKKKNLYNVILLSVLCSLSIIAHAQNIELSGQMKGLGSATVKIGYSKDGVFKTDSVKASNDIFTWKADSFDPQIMSITVNRSSYSFFAQPGHIKLTGVKDSMQTYKITGSQIQEDAVAFSEYIKDITDQEAPLRSGYKQASAEEKVTIDKKLNDLETQKEIKVKQFISDHSKSYYCIYMITRRTMGGSGYDEVKALYNLLDESAKQTDAGKKLTEKLQVLKKSRIGTPMTNFTQPDTSGNPVEFSSFKGKYVLVDFWASWCGPCRAENPNVLKAYNAYKDKGFTVVGISLDNKAANWKKAIKDDKMPWTQLSDLKGWKNEVSADFGILSIPSNLLIDPSGKIVARNIRGAMLENTLKRLLN
ncbi:peroxiredoxin [Mucilaginibacter frigoritolerans]|uniref:Peroxiredoxin n=1 Tax=Mucilaginibacter frigoritolerans TaxID=652788 RepID=A0A562TR97_9SPHI|nr:TlpA disulfide reductase family protein [Mucilaginibacter frigoritolerans]TWI95320.1 peroxiredoxin [Mucilaginibacter frigoritolerans]